ncbi:MAG: helix-turn-helix domain-containing protein [Roseibium sp.]
MGSNSDHLTQGNRRKIGRWRQAKVSPCRMAKALGCLRSTIFREMKRNHFQDEQPPDVTGYFGVAAHEETTGRRSRK